MIGSIVNEGQFTHSMEPDCHHNFADQSKNKVNKKYERLLMHLLFCFELTSLHCRRLRSSDEQWWNGKCPKAELSQNVGPVWPNSL